MNDEMKNILDNLDKIAKGEYYPEDLLSYKECKQLLDYITNLQKENDILNDITESYEETSKEQHEEIEKLQQRIDKAIEYIKEDGTTYLNLANQRKWCSEFSAENILKILGGDEE